MAFIRSVTSLVGVTPQTACRVRRPPGRPQFPGTLNPRFRGAEARSAPLPAGKKRSRFGTVSDRIHWQALVGPLVVELFDIGFCRPNAGRGHLARSRLSPGRDLPTPAALCERLTGLSPGLPSRALALTPRAGFAPALNHHGLGSPQGLSLSPRLARSHRVERRDYFGSLGCLFPTTEAARDTGLLRRAPVELLER